MNPNCNIREIAEFPVFKEPHQFVSIDDTDYDGDPGVSIIRLDTKEIISNMSSQYQLIKHSDILDAVEAVFESNKMSYELKEMMLHGVKDTSMRARYILTDFEMSGHNPIVDINNSYDGLSKFHIQFGVWRQVCSNGMMGYGKEFIYDKIHIRESVTLEGLFDSIDKYINGNFLLLVNKTEQLRRREPLPLKFLLEDMRPKESQDFVVSELIDKYYKELGENRLAQLNAITDFSKSLNTERRIFFETNILKTLS